MSLILDALNKSDQERPEGDAVPGLQTRHGEIAAGDSAVRTYAWPAATLLFALLALGGWWYGAGGTGGESADDVPTPSAQQPPMQTQQLASAGAPETAAVTPAQPSASLVTEPMQAPAPVVSKRDSIAALYAGRDTQALPNDPTESAAGPQLPESSEQEPTATRSVEPAKLEDASEQANPGYDVAELANAAKQELQSLPREQEPVVEHAAPLIADLSQRTKDEIPTVFYSKHYWSTFPREREVVLNGETRREGDTIKPGLKLVEILEDSIVLDYRGTEFRLRSLNSWVNL